MGLLCLLLSLEAHFVHVILEAFSLEFEFVVFGLEDTLRRALFLNFLSMLNQKVVFLHFGEIALLSHLDELGVKVRNAPFAFVNIAAQLADLLLISALLQLQVQ